MLKNLLMLSLIFLFSSCNSQVKQNEKKNKEPMNIEIGFYPSSGGNAIYTISLEDNNLVIKNNEPKEGENVDVYQKKLSSQEIKDIKDIVNEVNKRQDVSTEIILDSWRVEVSFNDDLFYNKSDVRLKTLPDDIKRLISYLTRNSTVKIDLYGFS